MVNLWKKWVLKDTVVNATSLDNKKSFTNFNTKYNVKCNIKLPKINNFVI